MILYEKKKYRKENVDQKMWGKLLKLFSYKFECEVWAGPIILGKWKVYELVELLKQ